MLMELCGSNGDQAGRMHQAQERCKEHGDLASASLLEVWIDQAELEGGSCLRSAAAGPIRTMPRSRYRFSRSKRASLRAEGDWLKKSDCE
jgi:hypothetical protein